MIVNTLILRNLLLQNQLYKDSEIVRKVYEVRTEEDDPEKYLDQWLEENPDYVLLFLGELDECPSHWELFFIHKNKAKELN